jgi:hypothetical protein
MPVDLSPGSFAAVAISTLFWWTVLSPAALLAVAVLCRSRTRLRASLTLLVLAPPIVTLLPVAVLHGGAEAVAAAAAVAVLVSAVVLAVLDLARRSRSARAETYATGALLGGVVGGMIGSFALVAALLFG